MAVNPADPGASRPLEGIRRPTSDQAALERQAPRACDPALRSSAGQHTDAEGRVTPASPWVLAGEDRSAAGSPTTNAAITAPTAVMIAALTATG